VIRICVYAALGAEVLLSGSQIGFSACWRADLHCHFAAVGIRPWRWRAIEANSAAWYAISSDANPNPPPLMLRFMQEGAFDSSIKSGSDSTNW